MDNRPKTIFIDIDGTLLFHNGSGIKQSGLQLDILPGVLEKFDEWDRKGYNIILITGRRESERKYTQKQLHDANIVYDKLIMGIGGGVRVIINDKKSSSDDDTAISICIDRNHGISDINI